MSKRRQTAEVDGELIDRATGQALMPPSRFRPYPHLPPEPALPLARVSDDDPYEPAKVTP